MRILILGTGGMANTHAKSFASIEGVTLAGGVEMMSRTPMMSDKGIMFANPEVSRQLGALHPGVGADLVATQFGISRADCDAYAALSQARAQTVADLLINLGVAAERVEVRGYGERFPLAENASARGRAQNRRVEILFSDAEGNLGPDR